MILNSTCNKDKKTFIYDPECYNLVLIFGFWGNSSQRNVKFGWLSNDLRLSPNLSTKEPKAIENQRHDDGVNLFPTIVWDIGLFKDIEEASMIA